MSIMRVLRGGLATTVQDAGRPHLRHFGIVLGGAMDRVSHELGNRLVGNQANAATLEMTLSGDELEFPEEAVIAITGADLRPIITSPFSAGTAVPQHRPVHVRAGTRIRFHTAIRGCRSYLAVAGGLDVPVVMGSRSTYLRAGIGGYCGRILQSGDELPLGTPGCGRDTMEKVIFGESFRESAIVAPPWSVRPLNLPTSGAATLRVIRGAHFDRLNAAGRAKFWVARFVVSPQSDRMGYRMSGPRLTLDLNDEPLTEGMTAGTLQLPPDGNLILLMADSAPTGGYPRIAHVIAADMAIAAQIQPGQAVLFQEVTLDLAHMLLRLQQHEVRRALAMAALMIRE